MTEKLKAKIEKLKAKLQSHIHRQIETDERCKKLRKQIYTLERALEPKPQKGFYVCESKKRRRIRLLKIMDQISVLDLDNSEFPDIDLTYHVYPLDAFRNFFPKTRPHARPISKKYAEKRFQEILTLIKDLFQSN